MAPDKPNTNDGPTEVKKKQTTRATRQVAREVLKSQIHHPPTNDFPCERILSQTCFVTCCFNPPPLRSTDFPSPLFKSPAAPAVYPLSDDAADVPPSLLINESLTDEAPFPLR